MIYGLYQSAAGMMVNEYRQDVIANNIANAETTGFKRQIAALAERARAEQAGVRAGVGDPGLRGLSGGTWLSRTRTDFSEGALAPTGQATDVALAGPGFFEVETERGRYLTRDGRFTTLPSGQLVSATDGARVLGVGGAPLRINPRGGQISISEDGRIQQGEISVGELSVVDVENYNALRQTEKGRFVAPDGGATRRSDAAVLQRHLEQSGVEPVRELVSMIESSRAYQLNAQMVSLQDQSLGRLIAAIEA